MMIVTENPVMKIITLKFTRSLPVPFPYNGERAKITISRTRNQIINPTCTPPITLVRRPKKNPAFIFQLNCCRASSSPSELDDNFPNNNSDDCRGGSVVNPLLLLLKYTTTLLQSSFFPSLISTCIKSMGQVFDKLRGKEWRHRQVRKITDKAFDRFKNQSGTVKLTFEDLYIAVLLVYNDINKYLPGPHFDPPSKEEVRAMIQTCDIDLDGDVDREEFAMFMQKLTADTFILVSQGLILTLVVAPTVALATKRATEGIPRFGKVVQRLPNSVFASLVTLAVVLFQQSSKEID